MTVKEIECAPGTGAPQPERAMFVIGIGASAGGVDAIKRLIARVPAGFPHAFVVVLHYPSAKVSNMIQILQRETPLRVVEADRNRPLRPGYVYVRSPQSTVTVVNHAKKGAPDLRFQIEPNAPSTYQNRPIDKLFSSMAHAAGSRSVGIVLSGTGNDGSYGLRDIKRMDGFVLVQDLASAEFADMPQAALASGMIDRMGPPEQMVAAMQLIFQMYAPEAKPRDLEETEPAAFESLLQIVSGFSNIDFLRYKNPALKRRVTRRMAITDCATLKDYVRVVSASPEEVEILHREFLVGVTSFFRDAPAWDEFYTQALPRLFSGKSLQDVDPVKIWVAACSTGEEVYSLALACQLYRMENDIQRDFRIFATDVNPTALDLARQGSYPATKLVDIPRKFRRPDLIKERGTVFDLDTQIKRRVIFSKHDLLRDPPFIRSDLVLCRNVMIYFQRAANEALMSHFFSALRPEGILFVGAAEGGLTDKSRFHQLAPKSHLFINQRKDRSDSKPGGAMPIAPTVPHPALPTLPAAGLSRLQDPLGPLAFAGPMTELLSDISCAVILLSADGRVQRMLGTYGSFVSLERGQEFSGPLVDLVTPELAECLGRLLPEALKTGTAEQRGLPLRTDQQQDQRVDVVCRSAPFQSEDVALLVGLVALPNPPVSPAKAEEPAGTTADIARLNAELDKLHDALQVSSQDLLEAHQLWQASTLAIDIARSELKQREEEIEGLSVKLKAVNAEISRHQTLLEDGMAELDAVVSAFDDAVAIVDQDLIVFRMNPAFRRLMHLDPDGDSGVGLHSLAGNISGAGFAVLRDHLETCLFDGEDHRFEMDMTDTRTRRVRIKPLPVQARFSAELALLVLQDV